MLHNGKKFDLVIAGVPVRRWLLSPRGMCAPLKFGITDLRECVPIILFIQRCVSYGHVL